MVASGTARLALLVSVIDLGMGPGHDLPARRNEPRVARSQAGPFDSLPGSTALRLLHRQAYEHLQRGRFEAAEGVLAALGARAAVAAPGAVVARYFMVDLKARSALERGAWAEAMQVPVDALAGGVEGTTWFARGLGAARAAGPDADAELIAAARRAAGRLDELAASQGRRSLAELHRLGVLAAISAAQGESDELALLLAHARELAEALPTRAPPVPVIPLDELAGDLWLQMGRYDAAIEAFQRAIARHPARARARYGLMRAADGQGDRDMARTAAAVFLRLWSDADPRAEVAEARRQLAGTP